MPTGESLYGGGLSTGRHRRRQKPVIAPPQPGPVGHVPTPAPQLTHPRQAATTSAKNHATQLIHSLTHHGPIPESALPHPAIVGTAFNLLTPAEQKHYGPLLLHRFVQFGGNPPEALQRTERFLGKKKAVKFARHFGGVKQYQRDVRAEQNFQQPSNLSRALTVGTLVGGGAAVDVIRGGIVAARGALAARAAGEAAATAGEAGRAAGTIGEVAAKAGRQFRETQAGAKGVAEEAAGRSAQAAREGRALRAARAARGSRAAARARVARVAERAGATRAGRAAVTAAKSPAGRVALQAGKVATYPIRRPVRFTVRAQLPATIAHGPSGFTPALTGQGAAGQILGSVSSVAGRVPLIGNLLKDTLQLPSSTIPAIYLPLKGAIDAATKGDSSELDKLIHQYSAHGLLPAVFRGDPAGALRAIENHPLYSALEASGAYAVAGRGAGSIGRTLHVPGTGTVRRPLKVVGHRAIDQHYSKNVITKAGQVALEESRRRRGRDPFQATEKQATRYFKGKRVEAHTARPAGAIHRFTEAQELKRRGNRTRVTKEQHDVKPRGAHADGLVAEAATGIFGHGSPEVFRANVARRIAQLKHERGNLTDQIDLELNARLIDQLGHGVNASDRQIGKILNAAKTFAVGHQPDTARTVELGLRHQGQTERARLFPYAQFHMGATHGTPTSVTERLAAIDAEIRQRYQQAVEGQRGAGYNVRLSRRQEEIARSGATAASGAAQTQLRRFQRKPIPRAGAKPPSTAPLERARTVRETAQARVGEAGKQVGQDIRAATAAARERGQIESRGKPIRHLIRERNQLKAIANEGRMLGSNGEVLSTKAVHAHMRANGVNPDEVGFLSQAPGVNEPGSYNQQPISRAQVARRQRTGKAFRSGTYDASYDALLAQRAKTRGEVDRAETWDALIRQNGIKRPDGGFWQTRDAAEQDAKRINLTSHVDLVPLEISQWLSMKSELNAARQNAAGAAKVPDETGFANTVEDAINHSVTAQTGRFVLAPRDVVEGTRQHLAGTTGGHRTMQQITQAFKYVVLPTSDKWVFGNVFDQGMRAALSGISPIPGLSLYNLRGRQALNALARENPRAYEDFVNQAISGGHFSQRGNYLVHQSRGLQADLHRLAKTPGINLLAKTYDGYARLVFNMNGWMERQMEIAGFGKQVVNDVREINRLQGHAITVGKGAIEDAAKGLVNTDRQIEYARRIEDIFGRWRGNSPEARFVITHYAPFYLWARNATRFMFITLPRNHPIKTAVLSAFTNATEQERKKLGLDLFANRPVAGYQQGGIPGPINLGPIQAENHGILPFAYYSSAGVFGDYPNFLGGVVLPQFQGVVKPLEGLAWTGEKITNRDGTPVTDPRTLIGLGISGFAEATVPGLSIARRIEEGGGSSSPLSTVVTPTTFPHTKPKGGGSIFGGLERLYVPRASTPGSVGFARSQTQEQQIGIPAHSSGSSSSSGAPPWDTGAAPASSAPWDNPSGSSTSKAPWDR